MSNFNIFIIRLVLGFVFAVILNRIFSGRSDFGYIIGLTVIIVGLAYVSEYFRNRRS